ncbi:hypothetical protein [Flavobacterium sp.]|uniref:hypothetical protein n=1 Tax=Flavobacterium sp. TaxID=239 RepID=UPI0025C676C0|nr:hypothetical protein [Flavobacterium sp.]
MNRNLKILFITLISLSFLGLIYYYGTLFLCQASDKCKNCDQTSISEKESKANKFYAGYYTCDVSKFNLKYNTEKIEIGNIWIEKVWRYNTDDCFSNDYNTKVVNNHGYNIVIDFKKSTDEFLFDFIPLINNIKDNTNGGIEDRRKTLRYRKLPKEMKFIVVERNPDMNFGWTNEIVSDTLTLKLIKNE